MVLSYLRMEDMGNDLKFQWYPIGDIMRQAVRKYSQIFILKKIHLNFQDSRQMVLTDEKWLLFVIEQILSNALKYTSSDEVRPPQACITGCPDGYTFIVTGFPIDVKWDENEFLQKLHMKSCI